MTPRLATSLLLLAALAACTVRRSADTAAVATSAASLATPSETSTSAADRTALVRAADALIAALPADTAAACIAIVTTVRPARTPADPALLRALAPRARRVMPSDRCPPTYASSMLTLVDSLGKPKPGPARPAGYVDPYMLELMMPRRRADTLLVRARVWQGSGGRGYDCRVTATDRAARCEWLFDFVS